MDTSVTNTRKNIKSAKVCEIEWASLDRAAQVRSIELNGFLVMPNVIEPDVLDELRTEVERLPTTGVTTAKTNAAASTSNGPTHLSVFN